MKLKYAEELERYQNCPPAEAAPREQDAYRFVHDPMSGDDFTPIAVKDPTREFQDSYSRCISHSLSFFATPLQAWERFRQLQGSFRKIAKRVGTHLAKGRLTAADGRATPINEWGHFSLFEFEGIELSPKFEIVYALDGHGNTPRN